MRLWDPVTRQQWELPEGHEYAVRALAFSGDGALVASGSEDATVKVWSVADRALLQTLAHDDWVNAVAFGAGDELATGGDDGLVRLWNARTGEPLSEPLAADAESAFPGRHRRPRLGAERRPGGGGLRRRHGGDLGPARRAADGRADPGRRPGLGGGVQRRWAALCRRRRRRHAAPVADRRRRPRPGERALEPTPLATIGRDDGITALEFDPTRQVLAVVRSGSAELVDLTGIDAWAARACARANRDLTTAEWNELIGENVPYEPVCPER